MTSTEASAVSEVRNHWWWRAGWRTGRHFYACHITLDDQPQLRALARYYQDALRKLPGLDLIPPKWLHITTQGIGFTDEITEAELAAVTEVVQQRLKDLELPIASFHWATIRPEAVLLRAEPREPLYQLRMAILGGIKSVLSPEKFSQSSVEPGFAPHVSVAYVNSDGPAEPIAQAIAGLNPQPVTATFRTVSLLEFHRDHRMYEWTRAVPLPIGPASHGAAPPGAG
jgi:2'-5' RNA ligase